MNANTLSAKAVILGEAAVGKSSIIKRYFENDFDDHIPNTIGTAFLVKTFENDQKDTVLKLSVWDTCGQERFMAIATMYYRDADVIIIVIDAENEKSLESAEKYFLEIKENSSKNPFIVLVVNKIDMLSGYSKSSVIDVTLFSKCTFYSKIMKFMEVNLIKKIFWTSAKEEGINVSALFEHIAKGIMSGKISLEQEKDKKKKIHGESIRGDPRVIRNRKKNCC